MMAVSYAENIIPHRPIVQLAGPAHHAMLAMAPADQRMFERAFKVIEAAPVIKLHKVLRLRKETRGAVTYKDIFIRRFGRFTTFFRVVRKFIVRIIDIVDMSKPADFRRIFDYIFPLSNLPLVKDGVFQVGESCVRFGRKAQDRLFHQNSVADQLAFVSRQIKAAETRLGRESIQVRDAWAALEHAHQGLQGVAQTVGKYWDGAMVEMEGRLIKLWACVRVLDGRLPI